MTGADDASKTIPGDPPGIVRSSDGLGADALLQAFVAATRLDAREAAESDVWGAVAEKVADGDMATAWAVLTLRLGDEGRAVTAVLGLLQWLICSGRVAAKQSVDDADIALPATCCEQLDAECIGIALSDPDGILFLEAPNDEVSRSPGEEKL
jgi:hypothetical protein